MGGTSSGQDMRTGDGQQNANRNNIRYCTLMFKNLFLNELFSKGRKVAVFLGKGQKNVIKVFFRNFFYKSFLFV